MTMNFRPSAEQALLMLQGALIGAQKVRLSWGRSLSNKQTQVISCHTVFIPVMLYGVDEVANTAI